MPQLNPDEKLTLPSHAEAAPRGELLSDPLPRLLDYHLPAIPDETSAFNVANTRLERILDAARNDFGYIVRTLEKRVGDSTKVLVIVGEKHYTSETGAEFQTLLNEEFTFRAYEAYQEPGTTGAHLSDLLVDRVQPLFSAALPSLLGKSSPRYSDAEWIAEAANRLRRNFPPGKLEQSEIESARYEWRGKVLDYEAFSGRAFRPNERRILGAEILSFMSTLEASSPPRFLNMEEGHQYSRWDRLSFWSIPANIASLGLAVGAEALLGANPLSSAAILTSALLSGAMVTGFALGACFSDRAWYRKLLDGPAGSFLMSGYLASRNRSMARNLDDWISSSTECEIVLATVGKLHVKGIVGILTQENGWKTSDRFA